MTTPYAWSHSSLNHFDTCARQYEEVKVLRNFQDQKNDAATWGDSFHKAAEAFIGTKGETPLPSNMLQYSGYLVQFMGRPGTTLVEQQYALNRALRPTDFYAEDVWCRGIIDVLTIDDRVAHVDDHKTGKRKADPQQLEIFALLTFYHHAQVDTVHTAYHWVQEGFGEEAKTRKTYTRDQIPQLWEGLVPKLDRYMRAFHLGVFPPKKSGLCKRHCPVNTCEYWGGGR